MVIESFKRKLMAILNADVKGYSRLMGENEIGSIHILGTYRITEVFLKVRNPNCMCASGADRKDEKH